ncbi:MAG TPA: hypothetical protein VLX28_00185, partial [Thermoanaerobaculia bacterium]|nr:hypothetical protein [Thermoanaerobaculia bacterium]
MAARKASRAGKDWYSISVDTLRSWGLLLLLLIVVAAALIAYRRVDLRSVEQKAVAVITEDGKLLLQLEEDKRAASFAEFAAGRLSLDEARTKLAAKDFPGALAAG